MTPEIEKRIKAVQAGRVPTGYCSVAGTTMPKEWNLIKLGSIFGNRIDINHSDYELLSITADKGVIPRSSIADKDNSSEDKSKYKHICVGDIGYNTMRMWQGVCALSAYDGIVSPAYTILAPSDGICASYFAYLFKMQFMINLFYRNSQGLVDDTRCLKYEWFKNIEIKIPPISEQKKIAEILATQDRVIELKEKLIAEKQSQKKWFIQLMTTGKKRLPNFNGKWTKISLSSVADIVTDCINPSDFQNEKFEVYSLPAFDNGKEPEILQGSEISTNKFLIRKDMVLFNKLNVRQKRVWLVSGDSEYKTISSTEFLPIVVKDIDNVFLTYLLLNDSITSYLKKKSSGTSNSQKRILPKDLMAMKVKVPSLPEQKAIAEVLSTADKEISLLQKSLEQEKLKKKSLMQLLLTGLVRVQ